MPKNPNLGPQFDFSDDEHDGGFVDAHVNGVHAGSLAWWHSSAGPAVIDDIFVHPQFRRQGIATGMFHHALEQGVDLQHSTVRTDEGEAWARHLGATPREEKA